ncbi:MAG: hypothetical protein ACP5FK_11880 [bacterium]
MKVKPLKLWLLDADVIIDLLSLGVFDNLVKNHQIYICSAVIDEVKHYLEDGYKKSIKFREEYVVNKIVNEVFALDQDLILLYQKIPEKFHNAIHDGEIESLAVLMKNENLNFCTCDGAAIRMILFIDATNRGISVEELLKKTGFSGKKLLERHRIKYFKNKIKEGKKEKVYYFNSGNES